MWYHSRVSLWRRVGYDLMNQIHAIPHTTMLWSQIWGITRRRESPHRRKNITNVLEWYSDITKLKKFSLWESGMKATFFCWFMLTLNYIYKMTEHNIQHSLLTWLREHACHGTFGWTWEPRAPPACPPAGPARWPDAGGREARGTYRAGTTRIQSWLRPWVGPPYLGVAAWMAIQRQLELVLV